MHTILTFKLGRQLCETVFFQTIYSKYNLDWLVSAQLNFAAHLSDPGQEQHTVAIDNGALKMERHEVRIRLL